MGRLQYVDVFRCFAILFMLALNVFDFFSKINVHSDPPFYIKTINSVTLISPMIVFAFVSGMSVMLMLKSRFNKEIPKLRILKEVIKKYGIYILICIPFTWFVFGIDTFFKFNEAVQGICAAAILGAFILLFRWPRRNELFVAFVFQAILVLSLSISRTATSLFADLPIINLVIGFTQNMLFTGWYSVFSTVPIILGGAFFLRNMLSGEIIKNMYYATFFTFFSAILHITIDPINYYGKSFSFLPYALAVLFWLCLGLYKISNLIKTDFFQFVGRKTIYYYFLHYILIMKPLQYFGLIYAFSNFVAFLAVVLTYGIVYFDYLWRSKNENFT